ALELELGRLHADHGQTLVRVPVSPGPDVRQRTNPVDAGVRAEADEDQASVERVCSDRLRVQPGGCPVEAGHLAFDAELVAMAKHPSLRSAEQRRQVRWRLRKISSKLGIDSRETATLSRSREAHYERERKRRRPRAATLVSRNPIDRSKV